MIKKNVVELCIEYTLDYPDFILLFYKSLFRNGDINNLTFNGTSDLDSIQQLDNKSQNSGSYKNHMLMYFLDQLVYLILILVNLQLIISFVGQFMIKGEEGIMII